MNIKNPISITNIGDPYIIQHENKFYLYATSHIKGYYCWVSGDLNNWSEPIVCYEPTEKSFCNSMFWAPEVEEFDGKFYMYYTAHWKIYEQEAVRIGVAVAEHPQGPFIDVFEEKPMFDFGYGALDAHILKDGAHNYLYYSRAGCDHFVDGARMSEIYVVELGNDYVSVKGEGKLILKPEQPWERISPERPQYWNEGPTVIKHNGKYHMMYSANHFITPNYGIGGAVADTPMGPFIKYDNNPILATDDTISGPGHNSVLKDKNNNYYCVYHAHTDYNRPSGDRQVYITPLSFKDDKIFLIHPQK